MRIQKQGAKRVIVIEDNNCYNIKTQIVVNDIIKDIDFVSLETEKDCIKYVCEFFGENDEK